MQELKRKLKVFQKDQQKVKEKKVCEEFDKLIKKTRTVICDTSTLSSLIMKHKIIICLSEKYIIKSEE